MNDLNAILGLIDGNFTTTDTFTTLSLYISHEDVGRLVTRRAPTVAVQTRNSARVEWVYD